MKNFVVDTHLFRELGEHLVGRDSTALIELIKNSYDADATLVTVHGERLGEAGKGRIVISDNGVGMTAEVFQRGFLTIASRIKEEGDRRSLRFRRRFTGAKGVGRLAAHKLAHRIAVESVPAQEIYRSHDSVSASIDWDKVESVPTLDLVAQTGAISVQSTAGKKGKKSGTSIELNRLRRKWTERERFAFFNEIHTFQPPAPLVKLPPHLIKDAYIRELAVNDAKKEDPGMRVQLTGDLDAGEGFWELVAESASWVLEIDAASDRSNVIYAVSPAQKVAEQLQISTKGRKISVPRGEGLPKFQARILVREGALPIREKAARQWLGRMSGIRVYMEGFRVLPYGDRTDDWLEIDYDYNRRARSLRYLSEFEIDNEGDEDAGLIFLPNASYFGAVFLTANGASDLQMLVNREGFIPNGSWANLHRFVRLGVDLLTRERAAARQETRSERRKERITSAAEKVAAVDVSAAGVKKAIQAGLQEASDLAAKAEDDVKSGNLRNAAASIRAAANRIRDGHEASKSLIEEQELMRILAALGLQMAAFVHEVNSLLAVALDIESLAASLRKDPSLSKAAKAAAARLVSRLADLRRSIERQAAYLADISSPDARRRRARQGLRERFDVALSLLAPAIERRGIEVQNQISPDHRTRPMFPAEVMLIFSNLLSNAVKAADKNGKVRIRSSLMDGTVVLRMENSGGTVDLRDSERWFKPFTSTTTRADPYLGQGMGMGLPIVKNMIEEYGGSIGFVTPSKGFDTALEFRLPG